MLFRFRKKEIVLDCFTSDELVLQTAPVTNAIKHIPDWWRKLPVSYVDANSFFPKTTMKTCTGMVDYYRESVSLPLWSDLIIKVDANKGYQWQFSDEKTKAIVHSDKQYTGFVSDVGHLKIESPWCFRTSKPMKWIWSQPMYSFNEKVMGLIVLPGLIDFCAISDININMLIPLHNQNTYTLSQGQSMAHITPMDDCKVKVVRHLISEQEFKRIVDLQSRITFINKYRNILKQKQKFSDCPYHKE